MDELRGPNIQIVLHVKEGQGFGFLRSPFIVSGSLNGYMLETDPIVPSHTPIFDAELVWEADKRRFRSLRVQNVPVKVEVFSLGSQGRKDKVGYLLLSLLGAQPCPSNKIIDMKHTWHKLLGVKSEGKCCHPQLLLCLSVEDRTNTPTPRNELRMFHSNEVAEMAFPHTTSNAVTGKSVLLTLSEYIEESKRTVSSPDLRPVLLCDEGLIQIGSGGHLFVLSLVIGSVENLDQLLPSNMSKTAESVDCYITYSVFTHDIMTDRVSLRVCEGVVATSAKFQQRSALRLRGSLSALGGYFAECPHLVARLRLGDVDVGICSLDLRKLVPTESTKDFLDKFCNADEALTITERCYILRCEGARDDPRRPYVDVEMSLKYLGLQDKKKPKVLTARSATQLKSDCPGDGTDRIQQQDTTLQYKSDSCIDFDQNVGGVVYTNVATRNTTRNIDTSDEPVIKSNEITELIKRMCQSFAESQERLLARNRPFTSDMQVQCEPVKDGDDGSRERKEEITTGDGEHVTARGNGDNMFEKASKSHTCISQNEKDVVKTLISPADRESIMQRFVDELEDWKEKQQELFTCQLKRKEEYHLELLSKEWAKKRAELESKLSRGVEQCRSLAADLARAGEDFRLRGYRNCEREKKLLEAKKALEAHYTAKYQELREASQKMEDDMNHQLKLKDMRIEELLMKMHQLEKQIEVLKTNLKNCEKDVESRNSGLTKDQTTSLIHELRCLEEKLDSAVQSKAFFKEQWGRAVRELHLNKLQTRQQMLAQLQHSHRELGDMGLDPSPDENITNKNENHIKRLKDDFLIDVLANTPALDCRSGLSTSNLDGMEMFESIKNTPKSPTNDKLNKLIAQRDTLIQQDSPDEDQLKRLNHEIRNILLNCGS